MSFRVRLLIAFLFAVLIPLIVLTVVVRNEMTSRLTAQYERRAAALMRVIEADLEETEARIVAAMGTITVRMQEDNRFRRAAVDRDPGQRRYLLDYAGDAMVLTGLSMLQIQDASGRILSSGHFRNEYDRLDPGLPRALVALGGGPALARARAPDAPFLALVGVDSVRIGDVRFTVVAGRRVDERFLDRLARGTGISVRLMTPAGDAVTVAGGRVTPGGSDGAADATAVRHAAGRSASSGAHALAIPFVHAGEGTPAEARVILMRDPTELDALRRGIDRWFLVALVVTVLLAIGVTGWLTSRVSRPLKVLADKTAHLDLDRLDVDFDTGRRDEIGVLSRMLGAMTQRLRASAAAIRDAERRATLGEIARQVNHDIKNGLTPLRNVFRHLSDVATRHPEQLATIFRQRRDTLDSGMDYLEALASNYARMSPQRERRRCDVNEIVEGVIVRAGDAVTIERNLEAVGVHVWGDPLSLRRVLENLIDNAIDSLAGGTGKIRVSTVRRVGEDGMPRVRIEIQDTGSGMDDEVRARVFDDFYTTKEKGTGLGLSIVRRLVMDLDGTVQVESVVGEGSTFIVDLPSVGLEEGQPALPGSAE